MSMVAASIPIPAEDNALATRCRILAAAERSFREIGYRKTTVADIAKTLKMSPANVYRFFESKKAINEAVVERIMGEIQALILGIADVPGSSASDRLHAVIAALHQDSTERCEAFPRMHEMVEAAMVESWEVCRLHIDRIVAVFEHIVRDGVRSGEFATDDPAAAAHCLQASITCYVHPILVGQYPETAVPDLAVLTAFLLRSLRPDRLAGGARASDRSGARASDRSGA